jgi:hypothetical protein
MGDINILIWIRIPQVHESAKTWILTLNVIIVPDLQERQMMQKELMSWTPPFLQTSKEQLMLTLLSIACCVELEALHPMYHFNFYLLYEIIVCTQ